jgi:hypothetical protein
MERNPADLQTQKMSKRDIAAQKKALRITQAKNRRDSRDFNAIRRDLDTRNAANQLRASQLSQHSELHIPMYQPSSSLSSSSSSSALFR